MRTPYSANVCSYENKLAGVRDTTTFSSVGVTVGHKGCSASVVLTFLSTGRWANPQQAMSATSKPIS